MSEGLLKFPLREAPLLLVSELAVLFEKPRRTMARDIEGLKPDGEKKGRPAWKVRSVLDHLLEKQITEFRGNPDRLPPILRARHYDAEHKKAKLAALRGEYLDREETVEALRVATKMLADELEAVPDVAARRLKLKRGDLRPLQKIIDEARGRFLERLAERFSVE